MADPSTIGPYRLVRKLGAGAMGAVYEAIHEGIERRVAIKFLHPQSANNPEMGALPKRGYLGNGLSSRPNSDLISGI